MAAVVDAPKPKTLDPYQPQKVSYVIPIWLRDEQIRLNTARVKARVPGRAVDDLRGEPIAIAGFGYSLNETYEQMRGFKYTMSCSGSHRFLIDRGIVPTWHVDVDPQPHKATLIGQPHPDVEYLIASTCHPDVFKLLDGYNVKLWHVFDSEEEGLRVLPPGEWALTGGPSVGLRALTMARFLGFTDLHIFGMDGCDRDGTGKHAAFHPKDHPKNLPCVYDGVTYLTTASKLEVARATFHELDQMPGVTATFYGEGLTQHMARNYVPKHKKDEAYVAFQKPELISEEYRRLNAQLHVENLAYGVGASRHADTVKKLVATIKTEDKLPPSVLDYGCGKSYLQKSLSFPIYEYDPAIEGKQESPRPADLVCCLDVLEHIEPDKLLYVLGDLRRCVKQVGYFVINTGPAKKTLPDGRNTHLIQKGQEWWDKKLRAFFTVAKCFVVGVELHYVVAKQAKSKKAELQAKLSALAAQKMLESNYLLDFTSLAMRTEPYLIGACPHVMVDDRYRALVASFPPLSLFRQFGAGMGLKWSLSTVNNADAYAKFLAAHEPWRAFHNYVKREFVEQMADVLRPHGVKLPKGAKARWEFSLLPADGGCLRAHTDIKSKIVTVVVGMRSPDDEWQDEWGGGTDVLVPKPGVDTHDDYQAEFDAFDVTYTYPYAANQAVVFVKGDASWHGVRPMTGPAGRLRRTLTINIESAK